MMMVKRLVKTGSTKGMTTWSCCRLKHESGTMACKPQIMPLMSMTIHLITCNTVHNENLLGRLRLVNSDVLWAHLELTDLNQMNRSSASTVDSISWITLLTESSNSK